VSTAIANPDANLVASPDGLIPTPPAPAPAAAPAKFDGWNEQNFPDLAAIKAIRESVVARRNGATSRSMRVLFAEMLAA
jgi:hypothetical protein